MAPQTTRPASAPATFLRPSVDADPLGTSQRLSRMVMAGRLLRLRRDVYLEPEVWLSAAPWERYALSVAAAAHSLPEAVLCRESALTVWGVPLLGLPRAVTIRATSRGHVGRSARPVLSGRAPEHAVQQLLHRGDRPGRAYRADDLRGHPLRRVAPPSWTMPAVDEEGPVCPVVLGQDALALCDGPPTGYRVEPLGQAVADVVADASPRAAAVVVDAVVAGRLASDAPLNVEEIQRWIPGLPRRRRRDRAASALSRADGRADSPGESVARVMLAELGFPEPVLQSRIEVDGETYWADFEWPDHELVLEFDGRVKYTDPALLVGDEPSAVVVREKVREDRIRSTGRRVLRITWDDLRDPTRLKRLLIQAGLPVLR